MAVYGLLYIRATVIFWRGTLGKELRLDRILEHFTTELPNVDDATTIARVDQVQLLAPLVLLPVLFSLLPIKVRYDAADWDPEQGR